tara:strand:+ start:21 stop:173 length:153 start_codon:yes stop_codon:yes gene_type:complete
MCCDDRLNPQPVPAVDRSRHEQLLLVKAAIRPPRESNIGKKIDNGIIISV